MIAPPGADRVHLKFLFFDMSPEYSYNLVVIDVCQDIVCSSFSSLPGSPFDMTPYTSPPRDIATSSTGFVRIKFPAAWSGHTQARFVLYYNTDSAKNNVASGLITNSWHYVSAVVRTMNESIFSASVYVNGTLFAGPVYSRLKGTSGFAFAGQSGIAIGRSYPMSAPFGYFNGYMDELVVMDRIILGSDLTLIMKSSCSEVPQTVLCFSFDSATVSTNGSITDLSSGFPTHAVTVSQDRFLPWCITRSDGGNLVLNYGGLNEPYERSWGFCTTKPRLPGSGFDYEANTFELLSGTLGGISDDYQLKNLTACSNIPVIIAGNTAGR
jgi:hypothetical protein